MSSRAIKWVAAGVAALVLSVVPGTAFAAIDQPLTPLVPAADTTALHSFGGPPAPARADVSSAAVAAATDVRPASADLTAYAMPVGDQGSIGSCAAWSTVYGAMGYWLNKQAIPGGPLAPLYAYSQTNAGSWMSPPQDVGSYPGDNLAVAMSGIDSVAHYNNSTDWVRTPTAAERANAEHWRVSGYDQLPVWDGSSNNRAVIETALAGGEPVVVAFEVYHDFDYLPRGTEFYSHSSSSPDMNSSHAVVALGYDANGLRIQNSWGTGWGKNGYVVLSWDFVNQEIFDAVVVHPLVPAAAPASQIAPAVAGNPQRGATLSASAGTWTAKPTSYAYQWQRDGLDVPGATGTTYALGAGDAGHTISVRVGAGNVYGSSSATSASVGPVIDATPQSTSAPVLSGTPARGNTLSVTAGSWSYAATSYAYQWQRDGTAIAGATNANYTLQGADIGHTIRAVVTATNISGSGQATSNPLGPVTTSLPVNTVAPSVGGRAEYYYSVSAQRGTWTGADTYSLQWQRDTGTGWTDIAGETSVQYVVRLTDGGARLRLRVTATNVDGSTVVYAGAVGPVPDTVAVNTAPPTVMGAPQRGVIVTAYPGSWTAAPTYSYQWQREGADIAGATTYAYTPVAADVGAHLRVKVTATTWYGSTVAYSAPSAAVAAAPPVSTVAPVASGSASAGAKLSVTSGSWSPAATTFAYQWQRDGVDIPGAGTRSYTVTAADAGAKLRARVTATNEDGSVVAYSNALGPLSAPPAAVAPPVITGTATDASTLSASPGAWTGALSYDYQWLRNDTEVPGATSPSYRTTAADVGAYLSVRVTATNENGASASATSAGVAIVGRPLAVLRLPAISGTAKVGSPLTAGDGEWSVTADVSFQWRRCTGGSCADIAGATQRAYTPTGQDAGATLVVRVNAGSPGRTASADSAPTEAVAAVVVPPVSVQPPSVIGNPAVGAMLAAGLGQWNAPEDTVFAYQWQRDGVDVMSATSANYVLTSSDAGHRLRVIVTAASAAGTASAASPGTAPVTGYTPPPAPVAPPVVPVMPIVPVAPPAPPTPTDTATVAKTLTAGAGAASLRSSTGAVVAKAKVAVKHGTATVTITPKAPGYQVWVCPTGGAASKPCTKPVTLGAKPAKLAVKLAKGQRVRVVVAKKKR